MGLHVDSLTMVILLLAVGRSSVKKPDEPVRRRSHWQQLARSAHSFSSHQVLLRTNNTRRNFFVTLPSALAASHFLATNVLYPSMHRESLPLRSPSRRLAKRVGNLVENGRTARCVALRQTTKHLCFYSPHRTCEHNSKSRTRSLTLHISKASW